MVRNCLQALYHPGTSIDILVNAENYQTANDENDNDAIAAWEILSLKTAF